MPLTDSKLRNIKAPYKGTPELADRDGLTVRITPKAVITFNYRFRWECKQQRIKIGRYPATSLSDARDKAALFKQLVFDGVDPRSHVEEGKNFKSVGQIFDDFMDKYAITSLSDKTIVLYQSFGNKYVKPVRHLDAERHRYTDWIKLFDAIRIDTSPQNAGSVLKRFKTIFRWSKSRGEIKGSTCLDIPIKAIGDYQSARQRVLEWDEIALLWRQIESSKATPACKVCVQLLILTGARNSEIREARRNEFDLNKKVWFLPPERSKTKKQIRRALSDKVIDLIKSLDLIYGKEREFLIIGDRKGNPITTHAVNRFVQRMNAHIKLPAFVPHDFRRTISTRLSEKEVMPHVTEKMLGHELGGVMAIYNKHDWLDEQDHAYNLFWKVLENTLELNC